MLCLWRIIYSEIKNKIMKSFSKKFVPFFFLFSFALALQTKAAELPYIYKDKAECTASGCKNCQEVVTAGYKTIQCVAGSTTATSPTAASTSQPSNTSSTSYTPSASSTYNSGYTNSSGGTSCEAGFTSQSGVCIPSNTGLPNKTVQEIVTNLMNWLLSIFAVIGVIAFVISGIQYLISAGDTKMIETAKRNMIYSGVGILVGLSGLIILKAVQALFRASTSI